MTDATSFTAVPLVRPKEKIDLPLPAPVPFGTPLLIGDCATPLSGTTMLHLLLASEKAEAEDQ